MNQEILNFIDKYVKEIKDNSAAMFIGAGFSKSAGYVDWKNLLRSVAEDLGLDIDKEYDLVSLAQYNTKGEVILCHIKHLFHINGVKHRN